MVGASASDVQTALNTLVGGAGFVTTLVWGGAQVTTGQLSPGAFNVMGFSDLRLRKNDVDMISNFQPSLRASVSALGMLGVSI